ncbi:hypothetical protein N7509_011246 [Penicillium cosmopolitanum]|uniref:Dimethylaniline monooxygenase n=1 Tax=Penicillium cosmopolitanum TaxID=1131564 RepID=A0A9W9VT72_9EURO|nr:uncharacterized protein N7509_011246 [Penicillium cosmopolitanum]KAJ5388705.1 hypothetical protein N7509_011246 [Penicillium cosmopolitanum]
MGPRYQNIAVIGGGPSGISATKALVEERIFQTVRLFERRDRVGGIWHYDPVPDVFPTATKAGSNPKDIPSKLPHFAPPALEDLTSRTAIYDTLDSNVGAKAMSFSHTPFPLVNSAQSTRYLGHSNPTRPFRVVAKYLEELFKDYLHLASFNTTVVKAEKKSEKWVLTLRQSGHLVNGELKDYWWEEQFDAVVVASGHYSVPQTPEILGLENAATKYPAHFEHSKEFRNPDDYVDKKVVVVGGNVSSADLVADLHAIVKAPLELSQRGHNEALDSAWNLPNVKLRPTVSEIKTSARGINVYYSDGSVTEGVDKVLFATGYKLSYPFITPDPVTPNNRVAGFYQHIWKIGDPSLALVGQVRAAISFRVYEYQAVAVARYFAGRNKASLPSPREQDQWEVDRLQYKGNSPIFHEIKPDFKEYFDFLTELAGPPAAESDGYSLPPWEDKWAEHAFEILQLKDKYWKSLHKKKEGFVSAKL